ncbi:MAG TPA: NAD(P)H-dependent glycerol-3-phosphate dehydrogenase [Candidatus Omnitrophota bacterium]|nr:NAD(P)H-dependent glycerol-3-phosphate dehydrogenase [Candidatus Omnitrophota bacterium]
MSECAVIGAGAWGTTISILLAGNGHNVKLWSYEAELVPEMEERRENGKYLPGFPLPASISPVSDLDEALSGIEIAVLAVPTQFLRQTINKCASSLAHGPIVASASKGIEENTLKLPHEIIGEIYKKDVCVISGPNLSKEIANGLPAAAVAASKDASSAKKIQQLLSSDRFRVYTNDDVIGVELGGALKNVIAIAAGVVDGFEMGNNAKAAIMIRGIAEITRLGIALGAKPQTFAGLSGMGDLITTCAGNLSRNHYVGYQLAKGKKIEEILSSMKDVAEGVPTSRAAAKLAAKHKIELPITQQVQEVIFAGKDPYRAIVSLMQRTPTSE